MGSERLGTQREDDTLGRMRGVLEPLNRCLDRLTERKEDLGVMDGDQRGPVEYV
jgi:hypothetical protein